MFLYSMANSGYFGILNRRKSTYDHECDRLGDVDGKEFYIGSERIRLLLCNKEKI